MTTPTLVLYDARNRPRPEIEPTQTPVTDVKHAWNLVLDAECVNRDGYDCYIEPHPDNTLSEEIECFNQFWTIYGWTLVLLDRDFCS